MNKSNIFKENIKLSRKIIKSFKKNQNVLLYCHSIKHDQKIISDRIKNYKINNYTYNDIISKDDINIDLAANIIYDDDFLSENYKKKFDIIYLVNCPWNIYIEINEEDEDIPFELRNVLFTNLKKILNENGVIITTLSDYAILALHNINMKQSDETLLIELKKIKSNDIYKRKIRTLIQILSSKLNLKLLDINENKKYILNSELPYLPKYEDYYIFQKKDIIKQGGNNKYMSFKTKDNKIIRKKIYIIDGKIKIKFGKNTNGTPKYISCNTFKKKI
jgi:hypothetical protein